MIEAKRSYDAMPQLAAYMGMVHAARKEDWKPNGVVYGIATNGVEFRFCRLDDHGVFYDTPMLEWKNNADRIFSRMRAIIRAATLSSPSTTPIRDPMLREIVLRRYGRPRYCEESEDSEAQEDEDDDEDEYMSS
jgi:hypothetical protein